MALTALIFVFGLAQASPTPTTALSFSPDSQVLAIAGGETVRLLRVGKKGPERTLSTNLTQVFDVAWGPGQKVLAVSGGMPAQSGAVEFWDLSTGVSLHRSEGFDDLVYGIDFAPDGQRLAAASGDGRIGILDVGSGKTLATLEGHSGPVLCVAWSPDRTKLASGSADRSIRIWDAKGWKE